MNALLYYVNIPVLVQDFEKPGCKLLVCENFKDPFGKVILVVVRIHVIPENPLVVGSDEVHQLVNIPDYASVAGPESLARRAVRQYLFL